MDLWSEFERTKTADSEIIFVIDVDDPDRAEYMAQRLPQIKYMIAPETKRGMVGALNWAVREFLTLPDAGFAVGFMGDDHRPRTTGWDEAYIDNLREMGTGFVYGDDLFQSQRMPTQVAMTSDIPRALGWMCPPAFEHLFVDIVWLELGRGIDRIRYLPEVVIEHNHPIAGKARNDRNYRIVNSVYVAQRDQETFNLWKQNELAGDVETLRGLL